MEIEYLYSFVSSPTGAQEEGILTVCVCACVCVYVQAGR